MLERSPLRSLSLDSSLAGETWSRKGHGTLVPRDNGESTDLIVRGPRTMGDRGACFDWDHWRLETNSASPQEISSQGSSWFMSCQGSMVHWRQRQIVESVI